MAVVAQDHVTQRSLAQPLPDVPGRHTLVLFSNRTQQKHPLSRHSTCDFLGFGSIPGWVKTILEENLSRQHALQYRSFPSTQFWTLKTVDEKKVFFAAEDILFRNSALFCYHWRWRGEYYFLLAFPFCFAQLLPLLRAGDGVEGKHASFFRAANLSNLLLSDPVAWSLDRRFKAQDMNE